MDKESPEQWAEKMIVQGYEAISEWWDCSEPARTHYEEKKDSYINELARVKRERDEAVEMASLIENYLGFHEGSQAKQTPEGELCVVINYEDFLEVLRSARTFLSKIGGRPMTIRDLLAAGTITMETTVLGAPAVTTDGALVLDGADVLIVTPDGIEPGISWHQVASPTQSTSDDPDEDDIYPISECFSTRAAAEAAAKEVRNG